MAILGGTMTAEEKECIKSSALPVILGNSAEAHKISSRLFDSFQMVSLICGKRASIRDFFSAYSRFEKLSGSSLSGILLDELIAIAKRYSDYLLLLIPANDEYKNLLTEIQEELETSFIIKTPDELFGASPIIDISTE